MEFMESYGELCMYKLYECESWIYRYVYGLWKRDDRSYEIAKELADKLGVVHVAAELKTRQGSKDTLYCWDERMMLHEESAGGFGLHPERPDRIAAVYGNLIRSGLLSRCRRLPCREVKCQEVAMFTAQIWTIL